MRHKRLAIAASAAVIAISIGGCKGSTSSASSAPPSSAVASAACPSGMSPDSNGVCQPGGVTPTIPATVAPTQAQPSGQAAVPGAELTAAQQQAVTAAQGYLDLGSGFSYNSLLKQLTSQYGDGFRQADAKFAINYLHPNWDAQAVLAAKGYMQLGTGFSRDSLIQQLTSSYGDGFTYDQAVYAVNAVGL